MENNTLCNRHSLGVNNHTKMYVTYTRIYGWSDYGGESSYQPGYRLENMMWMTLLVYDYIIPGDEIIMKKKVINSKKAVMIGCGFVGSASVFEPERIDRVWVDVYSDRIGTTSTENLIDKCHKNVIE